MSDREHEDNEGDTFDFINGDVDESAPINTAEEYDEDPDTLYEGDHDFRDENHWSL